MMNGSFFRNNFSARFVIFLVLFGIVTFFAGTFVVASVSVYFRGLEDGENVEKQVFRYKYYQYNEKTEDISKGFMKLSEEIPEDDFVSYQSGNSKYLISNYDSKGFKCSATCVCETGRRNAVVLTRGITFLLAAASSFVAYKKAEEYLDKECRNAFDEDTECPPHAIIMAGGDKKTSCEFMEGLERSVEETSKKEVQFNCIGNCLRAEPFPVEESSPSYGKAREFQCDTLEYNIKVEWTLSKSGDTLEELMNPPKEQAARKFTETDLVVYCKDRSTKLMEVNGKETNVELCVAHQGDGINPDVFCMESTGHERGDDWNPDNYEKFSIPGFEPDP